MQMKLAGHKLKQVDRNEVVKTYLVWDDDKEKNRRIRGDDVIDEGAIVYKNGKRYEIFLFDFVNNILMLEEVT
jgi:hypothetical protein